MKLMSPKNPISSDLERITERYLKNIGLTGPVFLAAEAHVRTLMQTFATGLAALAKIDWVAAKRRLDELPTKSKEAMVLASSKGWFFGWHESLPELMALIEKFAVIEKTAVDELMGQYYRINLQPFTDELVQKYPHRASVINAAVNAHCTFAPGGYFLSIPVFIAQADGVLTEITGVKSAMMKAPNGRSELQASKVLRDKLGTDQKSLDLIYPILMLHEMDFMKSASGREKSARLSGENFTALNRHQVLHGESWNYGTEINSLKAFSFLAFIGLHLPSILELSEFKLCP
jgi:hypothetical protein